MGIIDLSAAPSAQPSAAEAKADPLEGWDEADRLWLTSIPPVMQAVAARHRRALYLIIVASQSFNDASKQVMGAAAGNPGLEALIRVMCGSMAQMVSLVEQLGLKGVSRERFEEAQTDVARAVALMTLRPPAGVPRQ